jgi:hypothetical protein
VRSELQTLSRRWKNLLPRLQQSNGSAPKKSVSGRKRRRAATR